MNNKGFELMVEGDLIRSKDFDWTASLNFAMNRNKVTKLYDGKDVYGSRVGLAYIEDFVNLVREGEPLGVFYVYEEDGYDEKGKYARCIRRVIDKRCAGFGFVFYFFG